MTDDQQGLEMAMLGRQLHDLHVGQRIDRVGRLVEDQQVRIEQQCPGDADALPLTARQVEALWTYGRIIALGKRGDEAVRSGRARDGFDFGGGGVGPAVSDIFGDGAGDQIAVLPGNRDPPPPARRIDRVDGLRRRDGLRPIAARSAGTGD